MRWLIVASTVALACTAKKINYANFTDIKVKNLPFENDRTGFYVEEFLYQLSQPDRKFLTELARFEDFVQKYAYRVIAAAVDAGKAELIKNYFPANYKEDLDSIIAIRRCGSFKAKVEVACCNADLSGLLKLFKEARKGATLDDVLQYDFEGTSTILHEAIRHNNLVLLRDCLGFDDFNEHQSSLPSADPNMIAAHPFIDDFKVTPLMLAITLGYCEAAELLFKHPQTDQAKIERGVDNPKTAAYDLPFESKFKMTNLFKRFPFKADISSCEGDNFAMSILNGRCQECLMAQAWNLDEDASLAVLMAGVIKSNFLILRILHHYEKADFKSLSKADKLELFETLKYLDSHMRFHMLELFEVVGINLGMDDSNDYLFQELQYQYYPSLMDLILTQQMPLHVIAVLLSKKWLKQEEIEMVITWALGRHDVDLLLFINSCSPEIVAKYNDPLTGEPLIHLLVKRFYPVTRDLRVISEIIKADDFEVEEEFGDERMFWVEKTVQVEPEEAAVFTKLKRWFSGYSVGNRFFVSARQQIESEYSKTVVGDLAAAKDFDKDLVKLLNPEISKDGRKEIRRLKNRFNFLMDTEEDREASYFAQAAVDALPANESYVENYLLQGVFKASIAVSKLQKACEEIKDFYMIGPEGYSAIHILASPQAKLKVDQRVKLLKILIRRNFHLDHLALVGESMEGYDEEGLTCTKVSENWTPLMMAVFRREWKMARALVEGKADPLFTAPDGHNCARTLLEHLHYDQ